MLFDKTQLSSLLNSNPTQNSTCYQTGKKILKTAVVACLFVGILVQPSTQNAGIYRIEMPKARHFKKAIFFGILAIKQRIPSAPSSAESKITGFPSETPPSKRPHRKVRKFNRRFSRSENKVDRRSKSNKKNDKAFLFLNEKSSIKKDPNTKENRT